MDMETTKIKIKKKAIFIGKTRKIANKKKIEKKKIRKRRVMHNYLFYHSNYNIFCLKSFSSLGSRFVVVIVVIVQ